MTVRWGRAKDGRTAGLSLMAMGAGLMALGMVIPAPELPSDAVVDVTPSQGAHVYVGTAQDDAESEGVSEDVFTVTAPDGTTTENHIRPDDTVWGIVTTPDGQSFTFGTEEN